MLESDVEVVATWAGVVRVVALHRPVQVLLDDVPLPGGQPSWKVTARLTLTSRAERACRSPAVSSPCPWYFRGSRWGGACMSPAQTARPRRPFGAVNTEPTFLACAISMAAPTASVRSTPTVLSLGVESLADRAAR